MDINKNTFRDLLKCKKLLYLKQNHIQTEDKNQGFDNQENSQTVRQYASSIFHDFIDAKSGTKSVKDCFNYTKKLINSCDSVIIKNPAFIFDNLSSSCAYLVKEDESIDLYEIKCSTKCKQSVVLDFCFLKYITQNLGINIHSFNVVNVNSGFIKRGEIKSQELLRINDITERVETTFEEFDFSILNTELQEADKNICVHSKCNSPYPCEYFEYCTKGLEKPNVFDLYNVDFNEKIEYFNQGKIHFQDLKNLNKNKIQSLQVDCFLEDKIHIEKDNLKLFVSNLKYPLYFLDFETTQNIIPCFENTKPYEQIPFMFSLHYKKKKNSKLKHKVFIGNGKDQRFLLALKLAFWIRKKGTIIVFGDSLEKSVLSDLAKRYNLLSKKLNKLHDNIVDLSIPFHKGFYYSKEMTNSLSLKSVLPSLYPNDESLDYSKLDEIHNGNDAMAIYPKIREMTKKDKKKTIRELVDYCSLDTFAMVKILEKFEEICS